MASELVKRLIAANEGVDWAQGGDIYYLAAERIDFLERTLEEMKPREPAPQEFNQGHVAEGCDRLQIITDMVDNYLTGHSSIAKAGCVEDIEKVQEILASCYQRIGCLDIE